MHRQRRRGRPWRTTSSSPASVWGEAFRDCSWRPGPPRFNRGAVPFVPPAEEDGRCVAAEHGGGDQISRGHEAPAAFDDAAHRPPPTVRASDMARGRSGNGGALSLRKRSAAIRARSARSPVHRNRIPNALMRRGQWNALETVSGVDCAWWSEFHHFTEKYTMGTSAKATMQATADQTARFIGSSTKARSARIPPKANTITAVVVRRGSQSHHAPQVGLAQIAPCVQRSSESTTPISIAASSRLSHFHEFVRRKKSAQKKAKVRVRRAFQAVGTWTYMMRWTS